MKPEQICFVSYTWFGCKNRITTCVHIKQFIHLSAKSLKICYTNRYFELSEDELSEVKFRKRYT